MEIVLRNVKQEKITCKVLRAFVRHCADKLMSAKLHENIHCTIKFVTFKDDTLGECIPYYDAPQVVRLFDVHCARGLTHRGILETLAHEITHLKQMATAEWYEYDRFPKRHRFKGEIIEFDHESEESYWLSPWEVEAMGHEYGLYRSFCLDNRWYDPKKY